MHAEHSISCSIQLYMLVLLSNAIFMFSIAVTMNRTSGVSQSINNRQEKITKKS